MRATPGRSTIGDHYEVLGIARTATTHEIREAYRAKARRLHPDRHIDGSPAEQETAASQMRDVNEAWRVLGDARRRRAYDAGQQPRPGSRFYADTTLGRDVGFDDDLGDDFDDAELIDVAPAGPWRALHALPWLFVIGGLLLIFVFTAYARTDDDPAGNRPLPGSVTSAPDAPALGDCVQVVGASAFPVDCELPNDGQVVFVPEGGGACPAETFRLELTAGGIVCLAR